MWRRGSQPKDDQQRNVPDVERARERTMNRAGRLLAAKPRSIAELRERLLEKLWTNAEVVDAVIEKLKEYQYLDDDAYARNMASSKLRQRPQGKRRLMQSMSQKKLDRETVESAVAGAFEATPEDELIVTAIERRLRIKGKPETREDTKKFYDYLLRQGFGYDLIREKMTALIARGFEVDES